MRKADHVFQSVLPGGRDNVLIETCHSAEHARRSVCALISGDKERATAEITKSASEALKVMSRVVLTNALTSANKWRVVIIEVPLFVKVH